MRTRTRNPFTTVSTAGLLLPVDLLARIVDGDPNLPGLTPKDYHLRSGERLNEAASRAWNECLAAWKSFRKKFASLPASDTGTTLTRDEWLLPLFQELGYGRLQPKRAIVIDGKEYPISHGWEDHVPIHLLSARYSIDRRTPGAAGAATRAPYSLLQELLNSSGQHRWGFVTNGLKLYLLHDNAALARAANVEFDLEAMMDGELYADFMLLFLLCHQSRVEIQPTPIAKVTLDRKTGKAKKAKATSQKKLVTDDDAEAGEGDDSVDAEAEKTRLGPENCWLERWANQADQQGTRARDKLRDGVEAAIKSLGAGFLTTKGNQALRERMRTGELSTQDYYRQLLRVVYRLLMLLVAEEKKTENGANLFHPPGTPPEVTDRYARFYSVSRIRTLAYERRGTAHTDLYESLKVLFLKLREGYAPLGIPGMGSFLFSDDSTPDLDDAFLANQDLLDAFRNLCYTEDTSGRGGSIRRPVDFGSLGSDELGSVYESLLELHPKIDTDEGPFTLGTASGNERKTTGSYYTPTSLINCLLDSALDPVVHAAIDVPDRAEAERKLLNLKVCDPACGSGHFLIAAAERMAMHLARLRTGDDEPNTLDVQHAKRDIIGRCIYGVDINPMAVELCKVALWMEAMEPGKPFSYLEHHIQCGNSLLGTTPALLAKGIPDDAFTAIEGDVKSRVSELKKQNKKERLDRINRQTEMFEPPLKLGNLSSEFVRLNILEDDSISDIRSMEERYTALVRGADYQNARLLADTWCAAFVWKKDDSDLGKLCPTERDFRKVESHAAAGLLPHVRTEVERLRNQYQFFHWHLAFPDVFRLPSQDEQPGNEHTGWNGGFNVVLGNPPWERININQKEWFASRSREISGASNAASRRAAILRLSSTDPVLQQHWKDAIREAAGNTHLLRDSGGFPLCGRGDVNTYAVFCELNRAIIDSYGTVGCIVPPGIAMDATTQDFFQDLVRNQSLIAVFHFENEAKVFPGVHHAFRFCLFVIGGNRRVTMTPVFVAYARSVDDLRQPDRLYAMSKAEFQRLCPNTGTFPAFRSRRDAELTKLIHAKVPVLIRHAAEDGNPWQCELRRMIHMSDDAECFSNKDAMTREGAVLSGNIFVVGNERYLPLYEAKMCHIFDHRYGTYAGQTEAQAQQGSLPNLSAGDHADPSCFPMPRYWVPEKEVGNRLRDLWKHRWLLGWRDITGSEKSRTVIATVIPCVAVSGFHQIYLHYAPYLAGCVCANLSSFVLDFVSRQKVGGTHLTYGILEQLPILPPDSYSKPCLWSGKDSRVEAFPSLDGWLLPRVVELTYTAWDLQPFAQDCGYDGPPFRWDEERRFQLRAELDAAFFHLYLPSDAQGDWLPAANESPDDLARLKESFPQPRDAVSYIMDTFPIVRRKDIAKHGTYRTKDTILNVYDAMQTAIRTGIPYQTILDPPPADPRVAHPAREAAVVPLRSVVVDPVFPKTDLEKVLCACLLDFVTSQPSLKEDEYVDLMILAMQPANCRLLLTGDERDRFDQFLTAVLPELIADSDGKPPWRMLLSTFRANLSIQRDRFAPGANAQIVRGKLPDVNGQFVALVLKAGERLRELQEAATPHDGPSTPPPIGVRSARKVRDDAPTDPALVNLVNSVKNHRMAAMSGATSA
ncbi:putative type II DNA modification enzyme [Pirellula staleyi DSM 6068]|uniref:site-specific DNA-methyltransferase (adenine-specific) n=1 Tax=Pirellula staleyi (strain ATCC 27377 / DSM 6068 / ICPB 4128) TaxID=530564 RepID=D2QY11_PIRSD|nr:N-6 DNA methylase [Pirellula staleyi]ADB18088.1 putative type II DNA modification enzyme [Pirellula staleyi DSM 6068]